MKEVSTQLIRQEVKFIPAKARTADIFKKHMRARTARKAVRGLLLQNLKFQNSR